MKNIPASVIRNILGQCNFRDPDRFSSTMLPISDELQKTLIVLVNDVLFNDASEGYVEWATRELEGVSDDSDAE